MNTPLPPAYFISVDASGKTAYSTLPTPELSGAPNHAINLTELNADPTGVQPPFDNTISDAQLETLEPSLESEDLELLRPAPPARPARPASTAGSRTRRAFRTRCFS